MSYKDNAISSDDPNAVEKLTEKLAKCQENQSQMKAVNAYYRKHGTCEGCLAISGDQAARLDSIMKNADAWHKQPFPSYELTNNSAEIRRLKKRIEQIEVNREVGFVGWEFDGGEVVVNKDINRLQVLFDEIPSQVVCNAMKSHGFHWSPTQDAWQRQLNSNAIYSAGCIQCIRPSNGDDPIKIQPKAQKKDDKQR